MSDASHLRLVALICTVVAVLTADRAAGLVIFGLGGLSYIASFFADKTA